MAGGVISTAQIFGLTMRESADDGSDFTNPAADYRRIFLGEDGTIKLKDSSGTVTSLGGSGIPATIFDAQGDIILASAADTAARLAIGTAEQVLQSNGTTAAWTSRMGRLLAVNQNATGGNKSTTSTTAADVDATNSIVTFTAPASGNVLVRVTCIGNMSANNQNAFLGLRESTTDLVNSGGTPAGTFAMQGNATFGFDTLITWSAYLTGVSAGSHTYKLSFGVNGGATFTIRQATNQPVIFEVWAA